MGKPLTGDDYLRAHGFAIHSRPKKAPPVWVRYGVTFTEREAHAQVNIELKALEKKK